MYAENAEFYRRAEAIRKQHAQPEKHTRNPALECACDDSFVHYAVRRSLEMMGLVEKTKPMMEMLSRITAEIIHQKKLKSMNNLAAIQQSDGVQFKADQLLENEYPIGEYKNLTIMKYRSVLFNLFINCNG